MTTATIWDELEGDDRPMTEADVRKLYAMAFDDSDVTVAVQQQAEADFKRIVDDYIRVRNHLDPEWRSVPETGDEDADFDFLGESVTIEWKEWDRCGDADYFLRDFPISDLWEPDWEAYIRSIVEKREAVKRTKQLDEQAKRAAAREAAERRQLADLLAKYGVPPGYQIGGAG